MSKESWRVCSRRQFLQGMGGAIALSLLPCSELLGGAEPISRTPVYGKGKAKVGLVFSHIPSGSPTWPMKDYDYAAREKELTAKLNNACPGVEFTARTALNAADAETIVKETPDVDGYVVYAVGIWTNAPVTIMRSRKPVVLVDDLYAGSGETLIATAVARQEKLPAVTVSSSDFRDVVDAVRLLEVIHSMKESVILHVSDADVAALAAVGDAVKKLYGSQVVAMGSKELAAYYSKVDSAEAEGWADFWMRQAKKVAEPSREEIVNSGRMYLALCRAAADRRADAVTMDCLGMFYGGRITAYPCLSHFQMNNDGGTGVCEGDLNSTCSQLMMRYLTGRPGYVSDPVIDTARSEIIYAHCVSTNRVFGPKGAANPYIIRSHAEDGKGAVVQSLMPAGHTVTTLEADVWSKRMVIHTGKTVRNVDDPKACRTKLAAKTDAERILRNWDMGWHRVTVYGDWRRQAMNLARLLGVEVFEEDKAG